MLPFKKSRIAAGGQTQVGACVARGQGREMTGDLIDLGTAQCANVQRRDVKKKNNSKT